MLKKDAVEWYGALNQARLTLEQPPFSPSPIPSTAPSSAPRKSKFLAIIGAVQETEDSLIDSRLLAKASASRQRGAASATLAADLTRKRYIGGITDYFELVDANRTELFERRAALDTDLARALAATRLIQSLGGGWKR